MLGGLLFAGFGVVFCLIGGPFWRSAGPAWRRQYGERQASTARVMHFVVGIFGIAFGIWLAFFFVPPVPLSG
jgi:hypothetical protein